MARRARSVRPAAAAPVTWRDGVHLTGTPIWCDARRRRDVCFVSSADAIGRAGHGQLIGTPITLALVAPDVGHLAVPLHRPFTLGTLRLGLIPSGRGPGAAALHVDTGAGTVLYAGAIRTTGDDAAEVRRCDALVVAAPFGEQHHRFAKLEEVASRLVAWLRSQLKVGKTPVIVVDTALDGIEVASHLADAGIVVGGSRSIRDAMPILAMVSPRTLERGPGPSAPRNGARSSAKEKPSTKANNSNATEAKPKPKDKQTETSQTLQIRAPGREPMVIIRVEGERMKLPDAARPMIALVSGRALDLAAQRGGYENGFAWPFVAGRDQLLEWIEHARAKEIFVTGACADAIVAKLGERARVLGPPRQMALFAP